jgi:hypothetical protein
MKSFLSILMLTICLLKMGGYTAILLVEKEEIREQIEQKLLKNFKKSDLICILESPENKAKIVWKRQKKEFRFEGNFYDIAFVESKAGINYYYCIGDGQETNLEQKLSQSVDIQTDNVPIHQHSTLILRLFLEPVLLKTYKFCIGINFPNIAVKYFPSFCPTTLMGFLDSPLRPPER